MTGQVKSQRTYDSRSRRESARSRRVAILKVAAELFLRDGFAATTVASIASGASVSPETIFKAYGGKSGLIRALRDQALLGDGTTAAEDRADQLRTSADPQVMLRGWAALATEVAPKVSPIMLLVRDAAVVDPRMAELLAEMDADRHARMSDHARHLDQAGHLRAGVTQSAAADVLWTVTSAEMFELLVVRRGWTIDRYADFIYDVAANGLLLPT